MISGNFSLRLGDRENSSKSVVSRRNQESWQVCYIPYVYLVFRVFKMGIYAGFGYVEERDRAKKEDSEHFYVFYRQIKLTVEAALKSWCHADNMTARRLVSNYLRKQRFTILIAFVGILLFRGSFVFIRILVNDGSQNLRCALPHICLVCSLLRETRFYILIVTACCSYVVVFGMLCYEVVTFNDWLLTNNSHLFELLQDLSMDALNENEEDKDEEDKKKTRKMRKMKKRVVIYFCLNRT